MEAAGIESTAEHFWCGSFITLITSNITTLTQKVTVPKTRYPVSSATSVPEVLAL